MQKIVYVTGNYGKYLSVKSHFDKENIDIDFADIDIQELDINDISLISKDKVIQAYKILKRPCFAMDSGFYINSYPGNPLYPGAFVKRSGISSDVTSLLEKMQNVSDRTCYFKDCLTFYDGENFYQFYGESKGSLATSIRGDNLKESWSKLWTVFIPLNHVKTLAEMQTEERENRHDNHTSSTDEFIKWYKENYK